MGVVHSPPTPRYEGDDTIRWGDFAPQHEGVSCQTIAEVILDAPAADITLSDIPQNYRDLLLTGNLRNDQGTASSATSRVRFNGDTSANYNDTGGGAPETFLPFGMTADDGNPAGASGTFSIWLMDYARTVWHKHSVGYTTIESDTIVFGFGNVGGVWYSTDAITEIRVYPAAGNLVAGSRITVFGLV